MKQKAKVKRLRGRINAYIKTLEDWKKNHDGDEGKGFKKAGSKKK